MCITAITLAWSPTVSMLCLRRFLMPLSSNPWHTGENACLADMFAGDSSAYALAKSRISTLQSATSIGVPIVGGWLASRNIRWPWAVAALVHLLQTLLCVVMLEETLPPEGRRPFDWRRSSTPLSFLKLFTKGPKLRLVAIKSIWASLGGQYATYRYAEVHRQQLLDWDIQARGRYKSFSGIFSVCGSWASGRIISYLGTRRSLYLGYCTAAFEQLCTGLARTSSHFYAVRTLQVTSDVSMVAMQYTTTAVGAAEGFAQGELQGAISNLGTIVRIFTPLLWGRIYAWGTSVGRPSLIYYCSALGGVIQIALVNAILRAPTPGEETGEEMVLTPRAEEEQVTPRSLQQKQE